MLYKIARKIKTDYLDGLSFADRTGGLVRMMTDARNGVTSTYPIEYNQDKVLGDAQYMRRLVPNSNKKSVMYFEMGSSPVVTERHNNWYQCESTLKLVCWFNYQEVDPDMYSPEYLIAEIVQTIPFKLGNVECLVGVTCTFAGQDSNDGSIFSRYSYNEAETQFFKYPYDYFVLNFDIDYRVVTDCYDNDLDEVPVDPVLISLAAGGSPSKTITVIGVSGKEYQTRVYDANDISILEQTLHEYSGEDQDFTFPPAVLGNSFFRLDYGREYLRAIKCPLQDVNAITIPDDDNIRLEYIDLSDNNIATEQYLIDLIDHCYDTEVNDGYMDISGGTNAVIADVTALAQITTMVDDRGWTITHN